MTALDKYPTAVHSEERLEPNTGDLITANLSALSGVYRHISYY